MRTNLFSLLQSIKKLQKYNLKYFWTNDFYVELESTKLLNLVMIQLLWSSYHFCYCFTGILNAAIYTECKKGNKNQICNVSMRNYVRKFSNCSNLLFLTLPMLTHKFKTSLFCPNSYLKSQAHNVHAKKLFFVIFSSFIVFDFPEAFGSSNS